MKILKGIDVLWSFILPVVACGYLVYTKNDYSTYIMLVGWLMFLLHAVALLVTFNVKSSPLTGVWSIANILGLVALYALDYLSLEGVLIVELVSETGAYLVAILYFVLSNQKINGTPFWESQGAFIAIMNVVIITVVIYPFIAVWFDFIEGVSNTAFYWAGAISTLLVAVAKKFSILQMVVEKVNSKTPKKKDEEETEEEEESVADGEKKSKSFNGTPIFVSFIILWFVVLIILKNI